MKRAMVGARELKTRLGSYLQRVRQGDSIVTDRGEPVAELRPLPSDSSLPAAVVTLAAKGGDAPHAGVDRRVPADSR